MSENQSLATAVLSAVNTVFCDHIATLIADYLLCGKIFCPETRIHAIRPGSISFANGLTYCTSARSPYQAVVPTAEPSGSDSRYQILDLKVTQQVPAQSVGPFRYLHIDEVGWVYYPSHLDVLSVDALKHFSREYAQFHFSRDRVSGAYFARLREPPKHVSVKDLIPLPFRGEGELLCLSQPSIEQAPIWLLVIHQASGEWVRLDWEMSAIVSGGSLDGAVVSACYDRKTGVVAVQAPRGCWERLEMGMPSERELQRLARDEKERQDQREAAERYQRDFERLQQLVAVPAALHTELVRLLAWQAGLDPAAMQDVPMEVD